MKMISFHLPDQLRDGLEGYVRERLCADVDAHLLDLVCADLDRHENWMNPELAAAIE